MSAPAAYTGPADRSLQMMEMSPSPMESPPVETLANWVQWNANLRRQTPK